MVSKQPWDPRDLPAEFKQLETLFQQGKLSVRLFNVRYDANFTFFIGSFFELCPRKCHEGYIKVMTDKLIEK